MVRFPLKTSAVVLALALATGAAGVETEAPRVSASAELTLKEVVGAAAVRDPRSTSSDALAREADAMGRRASNLLGGSPAVSALHHNDGPTDGLGVREWELTLELPLWRPGERQASRELAERTSSLAVETRQAFRYRVAGAVRERLWTLVIAEEQVALARSRWETAAALQRDIETRVKAGDLSRADRLLARDETLAKRNEFLEAVGVLRKAEAAYVAVTGLDRRPADFTEELAARQEVPPGHPALSAARADVARSVARLRQTRESKGGGPELVVGARRERDALGADFGSSVGVGFRLPFATGSHHAPAVAAASTELTHAEQALQLLERELRLEAEQARQRLRTLESELESAREQQRDARENLRMARVAFDVGEMNLADLLRVQTRAFDAERNLRLRILERRQAIARYNQAVGETP